MNYFNPLLHNDQSSRSSSVLLLKLIKIILFFISSKQSPNKSISSYSIISMYFLPSSSVCIWSSLKWKPQYFNFLLFSYSYIPLLIFFLYFPDHKGKNHNEKIVFFFYLVIQPFDWLTNGKKPLSIFYKSSNIQQSQNKLANVANRGFPL